MKRFLLLVYITLMFSNIMLPLNAYANINNFLPDELVNLKLGMPLSEYQKLFPLAKCAVKDSKFALYFLLELKTIDIWNASACYFENDALSFYNLSVVSTVETIFKDKEKDFLCNNDIAVANLINKLTKNFGKISKKSVIEKVEDVEKIYEPLMVWENDTFDVTLYYTPSETARKIKVPGIILTFLKKEVYKSKFYPEMIYKDNENITFDSLLSDKIKKAVYNEQSESSIKSKK